MSRFVDDSLDFITIDGEEEPVEKADLSGVEEPLPDPYSEDIYKWVDEQIEKAVRKVGKGTLKIPGRYPIKSKTLGKKVEVTLYGGLLREVKKYLAKIHPGMTQTEVLAGVEDLVDRWTKAQIKATDDVFKELHTKSFLAGAAAAKVAPVLKIADRFALEWLTRNPDRMGSQIRTFGGAIVEDFRGIIADSFGPEGSYSVDELSNRMLDTVETERYKLERIVRTEVAGVSGLGRLMAFSKDPEKYFYEYLWINPSDHRSKEISKKRVKGNPYSWDEICFLWSHQGETMEDGRIELDIYNQRCSIARRPIYEELKGNRFEGDVKYIATTDLGFVP